MPQRRPVKLPGVREYLQEVSQVTAREAATQIVGRLIFLGPWYSGQFARNWAVKVGDTKIPATVGPSDTKIRTPRQSITPPTVPSLRGTGKKKVVGYTIDNRTTYRRVAMDLVPGRVANATEISAERDWYVNFIQGGGLRDILASSVAAAAADPKVKGFKGGRFIGPVGRLVNQ